MRAVIQRVASASVEVEGAETGRIGIGLVLLVGVHVDDGEANASALADRVVGCRIFNDDRGRLAHAVRDVPGAAVLAVSNFTVLGDASSGRRPGFTASAPYARAETLFAFFVDRLRESGLRVETGVFGADMKVTLVNDGPVTLVVDA